MNAFERIETLKTRHADLEAMIHEEEGRPLPDDLELKRLKREKLRIKDAISELTQH